jgi:PAS domain S-box-containing protein
MKQDNDLSRAPATAMLVIAFLMVAAIGYFSYASWRTRDLAAVQSRESRLIEQTTDELLSLIKDAETGQRGFLITGREAYLEPYNQAVRAVPEIFEKLAQASSERPDQVGRIRDLRAAIDAKLRELAQTISLRRTAGLQAAVAVVETDLGKNLMDDIRAKGAVIRDSAERRMTQFTAEAQAGNARLRTVSTLGSIALLGFIALLAQTVFASLGYRERLYRTAATTAERLRVTLNSIGDAVISTDAEMKITLINPVAQKITGCSEAEALGASISEVFHIVNETTRLPVENPIEKAIATGGITGLANHTILIAKDGREVPIDDSGSPIRGQSGVIDGAILVFRDISARREMERQLSASHDQLREFVDAAAHDLRTPLRTVIIFSQLLYERFRPQLSGGGEDFLTQVRNGAQRLGQLLEDLLSYAHAGHFEPEEGPAVVPMDAALHFVLDNLRLDIDATQAVITAADGLPPVPVRHAHLVQVLQNLIGNALKYHGTEPPRIQVACVRNDTECMVQVSDNGIGIDPDYHQEIFKPFKRLHGDERPGSGIGLATCQKIVAGYGGRIWVDSTPGNGSTFFFTIPIPQARASKS